MQSLILSMLPRLLMIAIPAVISAYLTWNVAANHYGAIIASSEAARSAQTAEIYQQELQQRQRFDAAKAEMESFVARERERADRLSARLAQQNRAAKNSYSNLKREIQVYANTSPTAHQPVFDLGFVRLWNSAINPSDAGNMVPAESGAAGGFTAATRAPDPVVSEAEILDNHTDNAERCNAARRQLNHLIDFHLNQTETEK